MTGEVIFEDADGDTIGFSPALPHAIRDYGAVVTAAMWNQSGDQIGCYLTREQAGELRDWLTAVLAAPVDLEAVDQETIEHGTGNHGWRRSV